MMKLWKQTACVVGVMGVMSFLCTGDADASYAQLVAPLETKGDDVKEMIKIVFRIIAGICLLGAVALAAFKKDDQQRMAIFKYAGGIIAAAIFISNYATWGPWIGLA